MVYVLFSDDSWQLLSLHIKSITGRGTYKRRVVQIIIISSMADSYPVRLDDFCNRYSVSIFNLCLPCIFCKFNCNLQDLASFHLKRLSIVWRAGKPFICCSKCALLSAKYEFENYCTCVVKASLIEDLLHKSLHCITIRCVACYQLLDFSEKLDCCARDQEFCLVRGSWRGPCRNCTAK